MGNSFKQSDVSDLLVRCHRRCCICHRFCGTKIETDHIKPRTDGGTNEIENAIPVCFECHAEIHSYNDSHPRGRKFRPDELRKHKEQWLRICEQQPEVLLAAISDGDVGPLQALIDELQFNRVIAEYSKKEDARGAVFQDAQFLRAIQEGIIGMLNEDLKSAILRTYATISRANNHIVAEARQSTKEKHQGTHAIHARNAINELATLIETALTKLTEFLKSD